MGGDELTFFLLITLPRFHGKLLLLFYFILVRVEQFPFSKFLGIFLFKKTKFTLKNKFPIFFQKLSQSGENSHHQN
jgi:hypothetical protein